jgi:hypothetical protein
MITTLYGVYNGSTWEDLCQKCFKIKYEIDGYQEMEASPGDFGIEGFTRTGIAFQCYCPDDEYTQDELYEKIRDKVTKDLNKLKTYEKQLIARLSGIQISTWLFITPPTVKNDILAHIAAKKLEVLSWKLSIIAADFDIQFRDIDFLSKEINLIRSVTGNKLSFQTEIPIDNQLIWDKKDVYQQNINRKNSIRLGVANTETLNELNTLTFEQLVNGDRKLRRIMSSIPDLYYQLSVLFTNYELEVKEKSLTWTGTPEELITHLKNDIESLLKEDFSNLACSERRGLVNYLISKWIALCPLNFVEE